jgi:hypothetical protein
MNSDIMNLIIDRYSLLFLDSFEEVYGRLPSEYERRIWMYGFIDGCQAIEDALIIASQEKL